MIRFDSLGRLGIRDDGEVGAARHLSRSVHAICDERVGARSIFRLLAEQGHLIFLDGTFADLDADATRAAALLAIVVGQDIEESEDGVFASSTAWHRTGSSPPSTTRRAATRPSRAASTDTRAIVIDADSETITALDVTAADAGDGRSATAPRDPRSSVRSLISCVANTALAYAEELARGVTVRSSAPASTSPVHAALGIRDVRRPTMS